jgi:hypothetical protein
MGLRVETVLLVASCGGRWCLVEGVIWAIHQRILTEHRSHPSYRFASCCSGMCFKDCIELVMYFVAVTSKLLG